MKIGTVMVLAAAVSLGACATTPMSGPTEVTRFHLGAPLETGTITIDPGPAGVTPGLEFQNYANAVRGEALAHGFTMPATGISAQYIATVTFGRGVRQGPPRNTGVSIGLGSGGYSGGGYGGGGGVGLGGGVSFPIGKRRAHEIVLSDLSVQIRRRSDSTVIWEGRAQTAADDTAADAQPGVAAGKLANALFRGFPGESGRTITVR